MVETEINYFTTVEEHFRAARGTPLFVLSPLDWALLAAWKNSGIPLEAILRGIDVAFEKWHRRPARARTQMINSLAYCTQAIATEAQVMANAAPATLTGTKPPFEFADVRDFVKRNAATLAKKGHHDLVTSLESLNLELLYPDFEQLEQCLTAIEEKMIARLHADVSEETLSEMRGALDRDLKPYRGKMTADQLAMLEKQFLERKLLEAAGLPRLSLFYL